MSDARSSDLSRQLDGVQQHELRNGRCEQDLALRLGRAADRGLAVLRADADWNQAKRMLWEAHLVQAEGTARQEAPAAYERLRTDLAIDSALPWTRATLLRLTPELLALDWTPVNEDDPPEQVADDLARNERIQRRLWLGSKAQQDLRTELRHVLGRDPRALHVARRLRRLGVTRLAVQDTGWRSVSHGREVDAGLHEQIDLTALETEFFALVRASRSPQRAPTDPGNLTALEPGRGASTRRLLQRLTWLLPNAWRGTASLRLTFLGRRPKP